MKSPAKGSPRHGRETAEIRAVRDQLRVLHAKQQQLRRWLALLSKPGGELVLLELPK